MKDTELKTVDPAVQMASEAAEAWLDSQAVAELKRAMQDASAKLPEGMSLTFDCVLHVFDGERNNQVRLLETGLAGVSEEANTRWEEALLDHDTEGPDEVVRRNHDYEHMLADRRVSEKARAVFEYLATTHGSGKQADLAKALVVNPARVTQLKRELEAVLAGHGYSGPLGRRPAVH